MHNKCHFPASPYVQARICFVLCMSLVAMLGMSGKQFTQVSAAYLPDNVSLSHCEYRLMLPSWAAPLKLLITQTRIKRHELCDTCRLNEHP